MLHEIVHYTKEGLHISILLSVSIILARIALVSLGFIEW